jgi:hypothetical protein
LALGTRSSVMGDAQTPPIRAASNLAPRRSMNLFSDLNHGIN